MTTFDPKYDGGLTVEARMWKDEDSTIPALPNGGLVHLSDRVIDIIWEEAEAQWRALNPEPVEPVEPAQPTEREQRIQEAKAKFYSEPRELHRPSKVGRKQCGESRLWIEPIDMKQSASSIRVEYYMANGAEIEFRREVVTRAHFGSGTNTVDFNIAQWALGFNYRTDRMAHRKPKREEIQASFDDWVLEWDANN